MSTINIVYASIECLGKTTHVRIPIARNNINVNSVDNFNNNLNNTITNYNVISSEFEGKVEKSICDKSEI